MKSIEELKSHMTPGQCYRRENLRKYSKAIDRHLMYLQKDGTLKKISGGIYYYPKRTVFGEKPPEDADLVRAFLKDNRFLITSFNAYNALGLGTTQLYNETLVYNHKRHGFFRISSKLFHFIRKPFFPLTLSSEYLLVDLMDNLDKLPENKEGILALIKEKVLSMDRCRLQKAIKEYGSVRTQKFFHALLKTLEAS
jgi:hypothetical protein